jgi:hypothetical protein
MLQLPVATGLDGTESAWVVQGGTDKRCTTAQIAALAGGGTFADWIIVTAAGPYDVPDSALKVLINKTDGADVVLGLIADKVGAVTIVAAQGAAHPFNVTLTDGTIMGVLTTYPFANDYQSATFSPVSSLTTWVV